MEINSKLGANYKALIFAFTYLGRLTKVEFSSVEFNLLFSIIIQLENLLH